MDQVELQYNLEVLRWVTLSAVVVAFWEYLTLFPKEMIIWRKIHSALQARKAASYATPSAQHFPFAYAIVLLVRYGLLVAACLAIATFFGRPADCNSTFIAMWTLFCINWGAASLIFMTRVYIIFRKDRRVLAIFSILWVIAVGVWIAITATYRAKQISAPYKMPNCSPVPDPKWRATGWGVSMTFDFAILAATLLRLYQLPRFAAGDSSPGQQMRKYIFTSCLAYFVAAAAVNSACFIVELAVDNPVLSHIPSPLAFAINPIVAIRVVFSTVRDDDKVSAPVPVAKQASNASLMSGVGRWGKLLPQSPAPSYAGASDFSDGCSDHQSSRGHISEEKHAGGGVNMGSSPEA